MKRTPLIIDTDAGIDDALAILLAMASPEVDIVAITISSGNCSAAQGIRNVRGILQLIGSGNIPVVKGVEVPLVQPPVFAPETHGETGLGYAKLPEVSIHSNQKHSVDLIIEQAFRYQGEVMIVTLGPLTNLALAIRREPAIIDKVKKVIIMGGAIQHGGNTTPQAEFNIYCDPHAAHIVFHSGMPIILVPLDVTYQIILTQNHVQRLLQVDSPVTRFVSDSTRYYMEYHKKYQQIDGCVINDPLALALTFKPDLVNTRKLFVDVDLSSGVSMGKTFADFYNFLKQKANMSVALNVKSRVFIDLFLDRIVKLATRNLQ
ncbi:MAG: nucleoside hydrolase [Anaerolineales bacterium]|nr:nucleoside hydrolase [Anaerolineales bacterium]